jgi:Nucleotidyltransferase of unknown function (DUF6036)
MPSEPKPDIKLLAPWAAFLDELDSLVPEPLALHCIGGFVLTVLYGVPRVTSDLDCVAILPHHDLEAIAGRGSPLAKKHRVYLQYVAVNTMLQDYETRLKELFPRRFKNLRIFVPDPYDLILSKLERNSPKDREDVDYLANKLKLDRNLLRERYEREQRPNLSNEPRHDLTLKLWMDLFSLQAPSPDERQN